MPIKKSKVTRSITKSNEPDVRWVPINSVNLWKENPRDNDSAVIPLARILKKFGQRTPLEVWRKNNVVYKGNTTLKAMKRNGERFVKVQFNDFASEAAAKAYGTADNRGGEFSDWNYDILAEMMSAEEMAEFIPEMGFNDEELRGMQLQPDIDGINKIKDETTGIKATIKIICNPSDRDELRDLLGEWANDCGFEGVIVK